MTLEAGDSNASTGGSSSLSAGASYLRGWRHSDAVSISTGSSSNGNSGTMTLSTGASTGSRAFYLGGWLSGGGTYLLIAFSRPVLFTGEFLATYVARANY